VTTTGGFKLRADRRKLKPSHCALGKVRGTKTKAAKVAKRNPKAGTVLSAGSKVGVKLG
jgi:beta-lactam-binding protein with PASTA domain